MYSYVLTERDVKTVPQIATKTVPTKRASLAGVRRYAKALTRVYPEQAGLIDDIAAAANSAHNRTVTKNLYSQLLDLERYLVTTI